jgi:arylformamidase
MNQAEYRAQFDATVTFANGGGLTADGFRVDVPGPDVSDEEVAALFVASLSLLMVDRVELRNLTVFAEPHKGTRAGPSDRGARPAPGGHRIIDLSHPIHHGLITYPGLPAPEMRPYLTRAQSRDRYPPGTEFQIDEITMVGNTGTYLDSPYHRYPDGTALASLPLESCCDRPDRATRSPISSAPGPAGVEVFSGSRRRGLRPTGRRSALGGR